LGERSIRPIKLKYTDNKKEEMMKSESNDNKKNTRPGSILGIGIALGAGLGLGFGFLTGNIATGIAIGIAIGLTVGIALERQQKGANDSE
jgi:uncharacterized membrane protein YgaE (UPF0421/DUF939 family)